MGRRPSRHIRRVKTRKGFKKVIINPNIRKMIRKKSYPAPGQTMPRAQNKSEKKVADYESALLTLKAFSETPNNQLTPAEKENLERSKRVVENFNPQNRFTRDELIRSVQRDYFGRR